MLQVPVGANRNFSSVASGLAASRLSTGSGNVFPCLAAASNGRVVLLGTSSVASGARGMATSKRTKRTWYGMRVSDDPTAPSVVRRKPTTPSLRHTAMVDKTYLWRGRPVKSLTFGLRKKAGRNNTGRITVWHRGGGNKRKYRMIDFRRANLHSEGVRYTVVERIEYDPNRSALIALLRHCKADATEEEKAKSALSYIVCPRGIVVGSELQASRSQGLDVLPGNAMPLRFIPTGTIVHNVELYPGHGAQLARSAGTSIQLLERNEETGYALLRLQSKEQRYVPIDCIATIGKVSNPEYKNESWGKAGRSRWFGWRPTVRGSAMNPIDHPMGGGEGKSKGGHHPTTPWGRKTKGLRTVRKRGPLIRTPRFKAK